MDEYIKRASKIVSKHSKKWIDFALKLLEKNSSILEIGSGTGRDADYMESQRFTITRTDTHPDFIIFQKNLGHKIEHLNILTDHIQKKFNMIFANAVFLHFNDEQLFQIFNTIKTALIPKGLLVLKLPAFDFLYGNHDVFVYTRKRYNKILLNQLLKQ